jgi:pimeloyl-ACP methyl ester carboxylesterase
VKNPQRKKQFAPIQNPKGGSMKPLASVHKGTFSSEFASLNGLSLHYLKQGTGHETIFFLHGFPEYSGSWLPYLENLSDTFQTVAPDLRGYGQSSAPPLVEDYEILKVVSDIEKLARQLKLDSIYLVGHDWGGIVSWYLAALFPGLVKRLVIMNAPHPLIYEKLYHSDPDQKKMASYIELLISPQGEEFITKDHFKWLRAAFGRSAALQFSDEKWEGLLASWKQGLRGPVNYYKANLGRSIVETKNLSHITTPTLILWGEKDSALSLKNLHGIENFVPYCSIKRFAHASHFINHEMAPLIMGEIRNFFSDKTTNF